MRFMEAALSASKAQQVSSQTSGQLLPLIHLQAFPERLHNDRLIIVKAGALTRAFVGCIIFSNGPC